MPRRRAPRKNKPAASEARGVEVLTIVWMLSVFTTLLSELGSVAARALASLAPDATALAVLSGTLLFAAAVIGAISLLLTLPVVRLRRRPPPRGIVVFAVAISVAPFLVMLARLWA